MFAQSSRNTTSPAFLIFGHLDKDVKSAGRGAVSIRCFCCIVCYHLCLSSFSPLSVFWNGGVDDQVDSRTFILHPPSTYETLALMVNASKATCCLPSRSDITLRGVSISTSMNTHRVEKSQTT